MLNPYLLGVTLPAYDFGMDVPPQTPQFNYDPNSGYSQQDFNYAVDTYNKIYGNNGAEPYGGVDKYIDDTAKMYMNARNYYSKPLMVDDVPPQTPQQTGQPAQEDIDFATSMYDKMYGGRIEPAMGRDEYIKKEALDAYKERMRVENEMNRMIQNTESGSYKVRRGDTLSRIARKYGISVEDLAELNNIKDVNKIRAGQTLRYNKRYVRPATRKSSKNTHKSGMKNPSNYRVVRNAYGQYAFM